MRSLLQGFLIGLSIVLPGMSGGTVILILGLYEKSIRDLSRLNLKPYIIIGLGVLVGIFAGGQVFAQLFILYRDPTAAFFLGIILASIKALFRGRPTLNPARVFIVLGGLPLGAGTRLYYGQKRSSLAGTYCCRRAIHCNNAASRRPGKRCPYRDGHVR
ncbi:MAG: DUF368 domain-containing protein [Firmicutes bacterium]|nr:DUF368 domain-containing protein [Bacillota bacterium]